MGSQRVRHDLATKQQILGYHLESRSICDVTFNHHVTPSNPKSFPNLIFYDLMVLKIAGQVIFISPSTVLVLRFVKVGPGWGFWGGTPQRYCVIFMTYQGYI